MTSRQTNHVRGIGRVALLAALVLLASASFTARGDAQSGASIQVQGPASPVTVGQVFTVTITAANVQNLGALEFEFNYEGAVVATDANRIALGPFLGSTGRSTGALRLPSSPNQPGAPLFGAYSYGAAAGPTGSGVVATVSMTAIAPGISSLSLTGLKVTDVTGHELPASSTVGSVTVNNTVTTRSLFFPFARRSAR